MKLSFIKKLFGTKSESKPAPKQETTPPREHSRRPRRKGRRPQGPQRVGQPSRPRPEQQERPASPPQQRGPDQRRPERPAPAREPLAKIEIEKPKPAPVIKKEPLPAVTQDQLSQPIQAAMARAGWTEMMPVQARTIPYLLARRNLMVQSRTGSGKTGAFVLPMLEHLDAASNNTQALVLVPTRELAKQVAEEAKLLCGDSGLKVIAVYGGVGYGPQIEAFREGAHLVVGTPGRVLDHLLKRSLNLHELRLLILDEADRMLSMGFYPDMKQVQKYLPEKVNAYMFSATFPPFVLRLADEFLEDPEFISLSGDQVYVAETEHCFYLVPPMDKDRALVRIIELENPAQAIIFCNTRSQVHYVAVVLQRFGYNADELSSDLSQNAREQVMARLRTGSLRFLVATDVAARGIDIPQLSAVIMYEPPEDPEAYIHRAGRTGRAGAAGEAISLVTEIEQIELDRIARRFHFTLLQRTLPTNEDVSTLVTERITAMLESRFRAKDNVEKERLRRFLPLAQNLAGNEDLNMVIAMLLDEFYQASLHAPLAAAVPAAEEKRPQDGEVRRYEERRNSNRRRRGPRRPPRNNPS